MAAGAEQSRNGPGEQWRKESQGTGRVLRAEFKSWRTEEGDLDPLRK